MLESVTVEILFPAGEEPYPCSQVLAHHAMSTAGFEPYWGVVDEHALVAVTSRRGIIVDVNDRFCDVSGYSRHELIGVTHSCLSSGHHPHQFWRDLWQTIGAGRAWHGEICNSGRDGSKYWVESIIRPVRRDDGILGIPPFLISSAICGTRANSARQPRLRTSQSKWYRASMPIVRG